jgi:indolepyruvate ferredoxin oxidoreductase
LTYKVLYNDAVALTGGQPMDGDLMPWHISQQLWSEGVRRIAVVTDEPDKYPSETNWAPTVNIHHRNGLEALQLGFREEWGVTAIIYDQTCAAEKRRRRKRNQYPDPPKRLFINEEVC